MKKILIIENDPDTLDIVSILLGNSGYSVMPSATKLSLPEITEAGPNLIIIDYLLNDGVGSDLCLELKTDPATKHIPVILFSASHHLEAIAHSSHADAFIAKPFDLVEFVQVVDKLAFPFKSKSDNFG